MAYEYVLQTYTDDQHGWEDVSAYDTRAEANEDLAAYRANQPEYAHRVKWKLTEEEAE